MIVVHVGVADVDVGGDVGEQRSRQRMFQRRRRNAADLEAGGHVGQQVVLGGCAVRCHATRGGLGGHDAFGHDQLGEPAPQLSSLTGALPRQCGRQRRCAQPRLANVDVGHQYRNPADRCGHVLAHRTDTLTVGV